MSYLSNIISDLESSTESFSAICRRHGVPSGKTHLQLGKVRPDLLGPRSERLGFSTLRKPGSVPDNVKDQAVAEVLAGRLVKDVAVEYGIPAPTLYKHAAAERAKRPPTTSAPTPQPTPQPTTPNNDLDFLVDIVRSYATRTSQRPEAVAYQLMQRLAD